MIFRQPVDSRSGLNAASSNYKPIAAITLPNGGASSSAM
jgi:hypothetical protein